MSEGSCLGCGHFRDDPAAFEAGLPGVAALSSAHASVRAEDGLCVAHDLVVNGRRRCASYEGRPDRRAR